MSNRSEHDSAALLAGTTFAYSRGINFKSPQPVLEAVGGAIGSVIGGRLPDRLDPPTSPNHRGLAHGILPVAALGTVMISRLDHAQNWLRGQAVQYRWARLLASSPLQAAWYELCEWVCYLLAGALAGFVAGYASHLVLDSQTSRCLPIIC